MDGTWMTLRRHWSDPHTSDNSDNVSRAGVVARGPPLGRDTRAAGDGRAAQLAARNASGAMKTCAAKRGTNAGAPGEQGEG